MSLGFLFHGSCLINDHVKRSFGTAPLCSATELLFFSSRHGRSQSNLWMSGSPQKHSEAPEKLDRGVGGLGRGGQPQNALMYFLCQRVTGRSLPKPCSLGNKGIAEVVGPPSPGQNPELMSFISSCWRPRGGAILGVGGCSSSSSG